MRTHPPTMNTIPMTKSDEIVKFRVQQGQQRLLSPMTLQES